jgi:dienelactone hydrolase
VAALRNRAPKPKFEPERTEKVGDRPVIVREVTFEAEAAPGTPLSLSGFLVTPARAKNDTQRLPALVLVADKHEAASEEQARAWAARGYAALALGLPGGKKEGEKPGPAGPEWTEAALASASPAANPLHASVVGLITAVSLLAAQPEVDARRIGLVGERWGGVVAALAGAVDDRPRALVAVRAAGGLGRGSLGEALQKLPPKEKENWVRSYDPDSYAKADHPASLFVQPLAAEEPPLTAVTATYRSRAGEKTLALIPAEAKEGQEVTISAWLASRLLGQPPLPEIRSVRAEGESAVVKTGGKLPPRSVALYYASGDPAKAEWKSAAAEKAGEGAWRCPLPKAEEGQRLTLFAALTDAQGAIVCSEPGPLSSGKPAAATGKAVAARPPR